MMVIESVFYHQFVEVKMEIYDGNLDANEITSRWYSDNKLKNYGAIMSFVGVVRDEGGISGLSFDL